MGLKGTSMGLAQMQLCAATTRYERAERYVFSFEKAFQIYALINRYTYNVVARASLSRLLFCNYLPLLFIPPSVPPSPPLPPSRLGKPQQYERLQSFLTCTLNYCHHASILYITLRFRCRHRILGWAATTVKSHLA